MSIEFACVPWASGPVPVSDNLFGHDFLLDDDDRRRSERLACQLLAVVWDDEFGVGERRPALLYNLSAEGLGLLASAPYPAGTILQVELQDALHVDQGRVRVEVVHVEAFPPVGWLLGCKIATPEPAPVGYCWASLVERD